MLELDELRLQLEAMRPKVSEMYEACAIEAIQKELTELEEKTTADGFWNDTENSKVVLKKISDIKGKISRYKNLEEKLGDAETIVEIAVQQLLEFVCKSQTAPYCENDCHERHHGHSTEETQGNSLEADLFT